MGETNRPPGTPAARGGLWSALGALPVVGVVPTHAGRAYNAKGENRD